jgi:hypothetical protein
MFLNIDGFSSIHRTHRYFKNRCIDKLNNDQTILPIASIYSINNTIQFYLRVKNSRFDDYYSQFNLLLSIIYT